MLQGIGETAAGIWQTLRDCARKGVQRAVHPGVVGWQVLCWTARVRSALWSTGIYLVCDQANKGYVIRRWTDGSMYLRGAVLARGTIESVTVHCDDAVVGVADLMPETSRRGRLGKLLGPLSPLLQTPCTWFSCRVDARKMPVESGGWRIVVRDRNGRTCEAFLDVGQIDARNLDAAYDKWRQLARPTTGDLLWMRERVHHLACQPAIALCTCVERPEDLPLLRATIRSLRRQVYPCWELVVACGPEQHERLLEEVPALREDGRRVRAVVLPAEDLAAGLPWPDTAEWIGPISPGDVLEPDALVEVLRELERRPETDLVYSDEDAIGDDNGRSCPVFKPDWSPDLLLGTNYIGRLWLARASLLAGAGDRMPFAPAAEYDLVLRLTEAARQVSHVPTVLYGKRSSRTDQRTPPADDGASAVRGALERRGIAAEVLPGPLPGTFRVRRRLVAGGLVSIIVHSEGPVSRACLESIQAATTYPHCEIVVVQGRSGKTETVRRVGGKLPCTVVSCPQKTNRTVLLNRGVAQARGDFLLFVEDATVVTPGWVEALLEHAQRPEVGAVGGRLVDRQGYVHQAGLFLTNEKGVGSRCAFFAAQADDPGPRGLAHLQRNCSAVGSACMMVRRAVFEELGGFDAGLDDRQGDVDFCLRAAQKGYRVLTTPHAVVCGKHNLFWATWHDRGGQVADAYWERWGSTHAKGDPFCNPNLSTRREDCSVNDELTLIRHSPRPMIDSSKIRKILIVKLDHLGDVLVSLPAMRRLRELFPRAEITALVGTWSKPLLANEPSIDRVLCYDFFSASSAEPHALLGPAEQARLADWLGSYDFDLAIDLRWDPETRGFLRFSDAPFTAGYADRSAFPWLTLALPGAHPGPAETFRLHITQILLQLVSSIEVACQAPSPGLETVTEQARDEGESLLPASVLGGEGPLIGIHPGAGTVIKRWPPESFARLADLCVERLGARIVLLGGGGDGELVQRLLLHMRHPGRALSLAGKMRFTDLPAVFRRLDLYIGNDSGPGHLAASLGVPTLTILASCTQPVVWSPSGPSVVTVRRSLPCAPCHLTDVEDCRHGHACMLTLSPESAWEAVARALQPPRASPLLEVRLRELFRPVPLQPLLGGGHTLPTSRGRQVA